MLDVSTLALFAAACLALTLTPGPDMLLILSRSVTQGRSSGFATLAGIQAGTYCHALAAAFGLSQLFLAVPFAYDAVRYAGAAYLLFLAYKAFRTHETAMVPAAGLPRYPTGQVFRQGLVTNLLNPKVAVMYLSLLPQFIDPNGHASVLMQSLVLGSLQIFISVSVNAVIACMAGSIAVFFVTRPGWQVVQRWVMGSVLMGLAVRMAVEGRR